MGYLGALVGVRWTLRIFGDPQANSTTLWLARLLPIGAALSLGGGAAMAWAQEFHTTPIVFSTVIGLVVAVLTGTLTLARLVAIQFPKNTSTVGKWNPDGSVSI